MKYDTVSDFDYELPLHLIAKYPLAERKSSRLLCLNPALGSMNHAYFNELDALLRPGDLLVLNDTKVIPARLFGFKDSGGKVECLIERVLSDTDALAQIKASKAPRIGTYLRLADHIDAEVMGRQGAMFELRFKHQDSVFQLLEHYGEVPLPSYIDRLPEDADHERYQTVYAEKCGAVAAPTAGLHFDHALLDALKNKGIEIATVTLHVGAGTYQPIRVERLEDHHMHSEWIHVSEETCEKVNACHKKGGRVIAVGTTSLRSLERAAANGNIQAFQGETDLFIRPGYEFNCVDILITNFHLPKSTLLMLVTAFGGYDFMMQAYREAIDKEYRFFSYGDAMVIFRGLPGA